MFSILREHPVLAILSLPTTLWLVFAAQEYDKYLGKLLLEDLFFGLFFLFFMVVYGLLFAFLRAVISFFKEFLK